MREHYATPWRFGDLLRAIACVLAAIAISAMLAQGCVPLN